MVQEKKQTAMHHMITVDSGRNVNISGVTEVISATATEVSLITEGKRLVIKGSELSMGTLDVKTGELSFTGNVSLIEYKDIKNAGAGFARLFR